MRTISCVLLHKCVGYVDISCICGLERLALDRLVSIRIDVERSEPENRRRLMRCFRMDTGRAGE
jgi:hypothetical protein